MLSLRHRLCATAIAVMVGLITNESTAAGSHDALEAEDEIVLEDAPSASEADERVALDADRQAALGADGQVVLGADGQAVLGADGQVALDADGQAALDADGQVVLDADGQPVLVASRQDQTSVADPSGSPAEVKAEAEAIDPAEFAAQLRALIGSKREFVTDKLRERAFDKQADRMELISTIFSVVSMLGLGLLLMPLALRRRYPGRSAALWKYSALATLVFMVTINLFAGVFGVLRTTQMVAGQATNPQAQIVDATFDVIDEHAADMVELGPVIVGPTVAALEGSSDDPLPVLLLHNVQSVRKDLTVFETVASWFRGLSGVFGYLPVVLSLVTVGLFLLGLRQTLLDIVRLPIAAAAGEAGAARRVVVSTLRRVGRELLVTLAVMVVLVVVLLLTGALMSHAIRPAMEAFLGYFTISFMYLQVVPEASTTVVLISLMGTVLFLALDLVVVIVASALYVGKVHKILQRRLHDREPLSAHASFWGWGTLSLTWALAFPLLFVLAAQPVVEQLIELMSGGEDMHWGLLLTSGPVILVLGFLLTFWAARGLRAMTFLARYRVPKLGMPVSRASTSGAMAGSIDAVGPAPAAYVTNASEVIPARAPMTGGPLGAGPRVPDEPPGYRTPAGGIRAGATASHPPVGSTPPRAGRRW